MRTHLILSALLLTGCTSIAVGPVVVESQKLGYESPYWGGKAEGRAQHGKWVGIAQAAYYDSQKTETNDGHGTRARALGGLEVSRQFRILGGVTYSRQETSAWKKEGWAPTLQVEWRDGLGTLIGAVERLDDSDDKQWVGAMEYRAPGAWPFFVRFEYVDYETLFSEGSGRRYEIGFLLPLWRRR